METIKELEAKPQYPRQMIEENKHFDSAVRHIQIQTLKEVLGVIDERIKRLKIELENIPTESRIRMSLVINEKIFELEELKARIEG